MDRMDFIEFRDQEILDLTNKSVYVYTDGFPYKDIMKGYQVFDIVSEGSEYKVIDSQGEELLKTYSDHIEKIHQPADRFEKPYAVNVPLSNTSKEVNVLNELLFIIHQKFSFGGGEPYENIVKDITVDDTAV